MKRAANSKIRLLAGVAALFAAASGGCVYTWRSYWWDFYDRGLSRSSQGEVQEAAADFEKAVGKEKGAVVSRPKDARRVRTYGMHFIDDYFPHRELGIAYYRMKRFVEAERELAISLEQTPSAKAKVYLNLVRKELLGEKPAQETPPTLELKVPGGEYVNSVRVGLTGIAESKNYVSSILINGERLFVELAEQRLAFSKEVGLEPGLNEIEVEAVDLLGKSARKTLRVNVDVEYPAVAIENAVRKDPVTVAISGVAVDNAGISSVSVEGRRQTVERPSTEMEFSLEAEVGDTIAVEVTDLAGNTTAARVKITADMLEPPAEGLSRPVLLAMGGAQRAADFAEGGFLLSEAVTDGDRTPPLISLRDVSDDRVIYDDEFIFEGSACDNGRLAALTINGQDILGRRKDILVKYFTHRASLEEGANSFTVTAFDRAGNKTEKRFRVTRKVQEPLKVAARLTLALLPLREDGSTRSATGQIYDLLLGSFLACGRFNFVERDLAAFAALLTELKIGNSALADKATAVRIGRIKSAEGMLYGKSIEDEASITVDLWLVDTETSEILFFADVYGEDKSRDELKWLVDGLVLKYRQHFPLVRGKVTAVSDDGVGINNGLLDGIWTGMKYLVLKEEKKGNAGALRTVMEARVTSVLPQSCFAAFSDKSGASLVEVNDPVITK